MPAIAVVGAQFGDEGKGKVSHYLAARAHMVVRTQGGNNAGHTVVVGQRVFKVHTVPSGILFPGCTSVIGNGVVVDPQSLLEEIDYLASEGVDTSRLVLSDRAHLIMPYHRLLDGLEEDRRGGRRIGTTRRGIGPAYMDKNARQGIRVADLMDPEGLRELVTEYVGRKNELLEKVYGHEPLSATEIYDEHLRYAERLRPYVADTSRIVNEAIDAGQRVVFEGAQGSLLDVDHGTYPYVTSSHPVAGGVTIGSGVGPTKIRKVVGVLKAYTSRVGDGPFTTELLDATGDTIRERGREYGTTTGRPRRIGWVDGVLLRYAARINGLTHLAVNSVDVLAGFATVRIAVAYELDGQRIEDPPANLREFTRCRPVYEELPGWPELGLPRHRSELPRELEQYLARIEDLTQARTALISVGREQGETIHVEDLFENTRV